MGKMLVIDKTNKGLISKLFINKVIQLSIKKREPNLTMGRIDILSKKAYRWPTNVWKDAQHC